jgi:methionyl-tRNA synthetase
MATIDDFKKLELKVAVIKEVAEHPNADRLYVLKISLGESERQVVAGIRAAYPDKEKLVGRRVVVITNLEPAVIRGVESQGMIFAASDENGPSVVSPDRDVVVGSIVK